MFVPPAREEQGPSQLGGVPRPLLWSAAARFRSLSNERPKQERDSLRNRSTEGRAGSRRNKRWLNNRELTQTLRRAIAAAGEDGNADLEDLLDSHGPAPVHRPSVFYRLLQAEGPEGALEALQSAEASRRPRARSRPRYDAAARDPKAQARRAEEQVRRAFSDTWQYITQSASAQELLAKLEGGAAKAFGAQAAASEEAWQLAWDGEKELDTVSGEPPAGEMEIYGLTAPERKLVHQLARVLGLHSESRDCDDILAEVAGGDGKAVAFRPPRSHTERRGGGAWIPPLSVSQVLLASA